MFNLPAVAYSGGSGTLLDPYQIATKADLLELSGDPNNYNKSFILTADIDFTGDAFTRAVIAPDMDNAVDSGFQGTAFTGIFNGDGYAVSNVTINASAADYLGLFGNITNATIRNLALENVSIVGRVQIGGLAGYSTKGTVTACYATGNIIGIYNLGGLVGKNDGGSISSSYATVSVRGSTSTARDTFNIGGLVGKNDGGTVTACYATGSAAGTFNIGGLAGLNDLGTIKTCYSTGSVSGIANVGIGGLVGQVLHNGVTNSSFWNTQTSGRAISAGGMGRTTIQMQTLATFTASGWDFVGETANGTADVWQMPPANYPHLSWEIIPPSKVITPSPLHLADSQSLEVDLAWVNGGAATSYNVYFGTNPVPANEEYQGNQVGTQFGLATLAYDTTYYWRIDAVNPIGTTAGDIWQFTTEPAPVTLPLKAVNPGPVDGALGQLGNLNLTWDNGGEATSYDVYLGTTPALDSGTFQGNQTATVFTPGNLMYAATYYWRIDTVNLNGTTPGDVWQFTTVSAPNGLPLKPTFPVPANGAVNQSVNNDITWNPVASATSYNVYFGTDSTPGSSEFMRNQTAVYFDPGTLAYGELYYWRIDVVNDNGTTTGDIWQFTAELVPAVLPSKAVSPTPTSGVFSQPVNTVVSWANGGDALSYNIFFGTDSTPDSTEYKGNRSDPNFDPGILTYATTYYWRVDSVNDDGTRTGDVWRFTTEPVPSGLPSKALNPTPADQSTSQSVNIDIAWTHAGDAISYDIYFGTDSMLDNSEFVGNQITASFDPGLLKYDAVYYWRIDAVNANGKTTGDVWRFTTEQFLVAAPLKAVNPGPAYQSAGQSVNTGLTWTNGGAAVSYDIYISTVYPPGSQDYKGSQNETAYNPGMLEFDTTYYWRIDAVNPNGTTPGDIWEFTTEPAPVMLPGKAEGPTPSLDATAQSVNTEFTWNPSDYATGYNVYFGTDSTPDNSEFMVNQAAVSFNPGLLEYNELYYWRIDAVNLNGVTTGDVWRFTTESIPVSAPLKAVGPGPADGAAGQSINVDLTWLNGGGASSYDVYFGTDSTPDTTELMGNQTADSFNPGLLDYGELYYWRIDAVNAGGTTPGDVWQFTTEPVPVLLPFKAAGPSPANGAINVSVNADLGWLNGGGASSYDIYLGTSTVLTANDYKGNQFAAVYDSPTLAYNTTYSWRIDAANVNGTTTGDVWQFTTEASPVVPLAIIAQKCTAKAGKVRGLDSVLFYGLLDAKEADILASADIMIQISAQDMPAPQSWIFPINGTTYKKSKFAAKTATSYLKFDTKTGKLRFSAKSADLKGLACPIAVTVTIGGCSAQVALDEPVVNGTKSCPIPLLMGAKDTLAVTKYKVTKGKTPGTDSFKAQGTFTLAGGYDKANPLTITLGTQTFTVPGQQFTAKSNVETCKKSLLSEGTLVDAKFDFVKCTYTIAVKNTQLPQTGTVDLAINCFGTNLEKSAAITIN